MVNISDFEREIECEYKDEKYCVRDNGAIMRLPRTQTSSRKKDNVWTFGDTLHNGYLYYCGVPVHRIVCSAFNGIAPTDQHVVDHIDTNRQNNRPENLRWLTKLENILNNEITRRKVELVCGSIEAFLENPQLLFGHDKDDRNFAWMRAVTKEEAANSLANMKNWLREQKTPSGGNIGNWMFEEHYQDFSMPVVSMDTEKTFNSHERMPGETTWDELLASFSQKTESNTQKEVTNSALYDNFRNASPEIVDIHQFDNVPSEVSIPEIPFRGIEYYKESLTQGVVQSKEWRTPTEFLLCPLDSKGGLDAYLERLKPGECFSRGRYCFCNVVKAAKGMHSDIIVYGEMFESEEPDQHSIKPYSITIIHMVDNQYAHDCYSSYFDESGAEKYYTILQGKEWTGGDVFDDWC